MAMGNDKREMQQPLFIDAAQLAQAPGHPFYERLNAVLDLHGFSAFVEERCSGFYSAEGRPSVPPAVYFKMLLVGYFEGIDSERGIAWRAKDSLCLREFLGYAVTDAPPDHSSLSRARRRIDLETHREIFQWVLTTLVLEGVVQAKTVGVDSTTLEANAAMRSIVRRDTGERYDEFLTGLARAEGIETPTREDLAKLDRTRKNKASNRDWEHPFDPDARIAKMKDGTTHLAHKAEHAIDMDSGALLGVALHPADQGDTETLNDTLEEAQRNVEEAAEETDAKRQMHDTPLCELVADKGYHSNKALAALPTKTCAPTSANPNAAAAPGRAKRPRIKTPSTPTGAASAANAARGCCANAANLSNAVSPIVTRPAPCAGSTCEDTTTSSNGCLSTPRPSTSDFSFER